MKKGIDCDKLKAVISPLIIEQMSLNYFTLNMDIFKTICWITFA